MENKDFVVFIISHGRPDIVLTKKTLDKCGYTGSTYFVLDNEDKTIDAYKEKFGQSAIIVFDKKKYADMVDEGNNFDNRSTTTHARNACFDIATTLGFNYFLVLDDDYYEFDYKFSGTKGLVMPKKIDAIFDLVLDFYKSTQALSVCFSQTGDFMGGVDNGKGVYRFSKRKAMNSFFCSIHRRFWFLGQLNEDVNTYTTLQGKGGLFLTIPVIAVNQKDSQSQKSGMSDIYKLQGTYIKSFSTVLMQPSNVSISIMNANHKRIHHLISWKNTTPMIVSEDYKK
jgi:hypothetical protein